MNTAACTVEVDSVGREEWDALLLGFDDANIYQTWEYGAVCWGEKQLSHIIVKRNGTLVGMAQVRIVSLPILGSGIAYLRWGPLSRLKGEPWSEQNFQHIIDALKAEYCSKRGLLLRIIPNAYSTDESTSSIRSTLESSLLLQDADDPIYHTIRLDLNAPLDDLRKGLHQRWRNKLKNAENDGFTVVEKNDSESYERFARAYREMFARKKFATTVDIDEFAVIQSRLPETLKLRVFVCEKNGLLCNALVVAPVGDTGIYLLAATSDAGLNGNGAFLLQWRAIERLKAMGIRWYDLGGINPEKNPGVYQFKSGLGGAETFQLGRFEYSGARTSSILVGMGEGLQRAVHRTRSLIPGK